MSTIEVGLALQQRLDASLASIKGITFSEYRILSAIRSSPNARASRVELARQVGLTPSGVTRALRPMEKQGMVTTIRDERDARRSLAALTSGGQELVADADGVIADAVESLAGVQALSDTEAADLGAILKRIRP